MSSEKQGPQTKIATFEITNEVEETVDVQSPEPVPPQALTIAVGQEDSTPKSLTIRQRVRKFFHFLGVDRTYVWVFLTIVGVVAGAIAFVHDIVVSSLYNWRKALAFTYLADAGVPVQFLVWAGFNTFFQLFAIYFTYFVQPAGEGSGIPAVKARLNGVPLDPPLLFNTFLVRVVCLPLVLGSCMYMGKTDMFIGAGLANQILRFPLFAKLKETEYLQEQILASGLATGVAANFGTPVAGVVFAVEIIGTYYSLRTYLKSFYISTITAFTTMALHAWYNGRTFERPAWNIKITYPGWDLPEIFLYALLGVIMGFLAALFLVIVKRMLIWRDLAIAKLKFGFFQINKPGFFGKFLGIFDNKMLVVYLICFLTSVVSFPKFIGPFMGLSAAKQVEDTLLPLPLIKESGTHAGNWGDPTSPEIYARTVKQSLLICGCVRLLMQFVSASLPVPGGVLVPLLATGAVFGRLFGEVMAGWFPTGFLIGTVPIAAGYGFAGAAALAAGVTHAFSTSIILMEMGGVTVHIPSLIAVIISVRICKLFTPNIYDMIIGVRGWPAFMESKTDREKIKVKDIMRDISHYPVLSIKLSIPQLAKTLEEHPQIKEFPVVDNLHNMYLLGTVTRDALEELIAVEKQASLEHDAHFVTMPMKTCSYTLAEDLSALKTHIVFSMLKLNVCYVIRLGKLIGVVRRTDLFSIQERKKNPFARFVLFVRDRIDQLKGPRAL